MVEEKLNFCLKYFSAVIKRPHESRDCTCVLKNLIIFYYILNIELSFSNHVWRIQLMKSR